MDKEINMDLIKKIKKLQNNEIGELVSKRISEFESFKNKSNEKWFAELCFCILTANSRAKTAINIQNELGERGFINKNEKELSLVIKNNKHRFHNNKAKFICNAREHINIKDKLKKLNEVDAREAREWLVKNIKGIGYKEASHFLRNTGSKNIAILDRHILGLMVENNLIDMKPKSLNKKNYLEIEEKFKSIAENIKMSLAELDLYMWYMKTGGVLK